jgi:hypothetical protein
MNDSVSFDSEQTKQRKCSQEVMEIISDVELLLPRGVEVIQLDTWTLL